MSNKEYQMALALYPKFPIPSRSKQPVRATRDESGIVDIGWCDGVLSDGRAFRSEMWAQDQISMLTTFFSSAGIEHLDQDILRDRAETERLITFKADGPRYCDSSIYEDDAGNKMWSVNVVVGDEDQSYLDGSVPIFPYSRVGEPNSMLNATPIKAAHAVSQ